MLYTEIYAEGEAPIIRNKLDRFVLKLKGFIEGNKYRAVGNAVFVHSDGGPSVGFFPCDARVATIHNLISGQDFVKEIKEGSINPYSGTIADIMVDGYRSNLMVYAYRAGYDYVDPLYVSVTEFEKMCNEYEILVNWIIRKKHSAEDKEEIEEENEDEATD